MLGITPLVSISESRLGLMMNSSMPRDSARWVLDTSTSRRVSPICSRKSRNFLPADNTCILPYPAGVVLHVFKVLSQNRQLAVSRSSIQPDNDHFNHSGFAKSPIAAPMLVPSSRGPASAQQSVILQTLSG